MAKSKPKDKGGRPRIFIDWDTVDKLCGLHCTQVEIAAFIKVSVDTLERAVEREYGIGYAEYYKQKAAAGKTSLRRRQFELAQSGNATMLIWLGKQTLGQVEKVEHASDSEKGFRVILEDYRSK